MISRGTKLAGVIGWPVAHSLSPRLHGFWLSECRIEGQYVALAVKREDFSLALDGLVRAGFKGVNVTVPHKEAAFAVAHSSDADAQSAGAANLLVFGKDGRFEARNTDVTGLKASLVDRLGTERLKGATALVLGAGGAARATILALDALKVRDIVLANRSPDRAETLASTLAGKVHAKLAARPLKELARSPGKPMIVVNATSAGMKGQPGLAFDPGKLPKACVVCDLVYNPLETKLLARAKAAGMKTIDGLGMLMHQGVPSFEAFFGSRPKVSVALRKSLEVALKP
jgi:shikimate dehydrogenase